MVQKCLDSSKMLLFQILLLKIFIFSLFENMGFFGIFRHQSPYYSDAFFQNSKYRYCFFFQVSEKNATKKNLLQIFCCFFKKVLKLLWKSPETLWQIFLSKNIFCVSGDEILVNFFYIFHHQSPYVSVCIFEKRDFCTMGICDQN